MYISMHGVRLRSWKGKVSNVIVWEVDSYSNLDQERRILQNQVGIEVEKAN